MPLSSSKIIEILWTVVPGVLGGAAHHLLLVFKGERFSIWLFLINLFLAGFAGWLIGEFLPVDTTARDGIIGISGFSAIKILELLEVRGVLAISKFINPKK